MLLVVRGTYVVLGAATVILSAIAFLEGLQYRGFDPILIVGLALGLPMIAAGLLVRRAGPAARAVTWLGVAASLAGPAYLLFVAVTSAQDAILLAFVPLAIAIMLALVLGRGRMATDASAHAQAAAAG